MKKRFLSPLILASLFIISCSSDDDTPPVVDTSIEVPATYTFLRDGQSSVNFSGQTTRILMGKEILDAFKDFDNTTEASLLAMYDHQEGSNDFSDANLNASGKSLRSKTAASADFFSANAVESTEIKATFDGFISSQINEVFPNNMVIAAPGIAGQVADGSSTRYVSGEGLEYNQAFAKGILGALMADQMLNNYLSASVLDQGSNRDNNDNSVTEEGKSYTTMEHKWDEAYGYLYGTSANTENPNLTIGDDDKFLNEYVGRVNDDPDFSTIAAEIFEAFKLGRAAIVAKNYEVRDAQAAIIRQKVSEVIAIRGIYYLQAGKNKIIDGNREGAFHALSEAYGFIYSLRFTRNPENESPYFTKTEVKALLDLLINAPENGLWSVTPEALDTISEAMAAKYSFTVAQASSNK